MGAGGLSRSVVNPEDARQSSERKKRELYLSHTTVSQGGSEDVCECCLSQLSVPAQWCRGRYFLFTDEANYGNLNLLVP